MAENESSQQIVADSLRSLVILLGPFIPHICEELWSMMGNNTSLFRGEWPLWNEEALVTEKVEIVVQINGKVRGKLQIRTGASEDEVVEAAKNDQNVVRHIEGKNILKTILVKDKLLNIVIK